MRTNVKVLDTRGLAISEPETAMRVELYRALPGITIILGRRILPGDCEVLDYTNLLTDFEVGVLARTEGT